MKKILFAVIATTMFLASCGGSSETETTTTDSLSVSTDSLCCKNDSVVCDSTLSVDSVTVVN